MSFPEEAKGTCLAAARSLEAIHTLPPLLRALLPPPLLRLLLLLQLQPDHYALAGTAQAVAKEQPAPAADRRLLPLPPRRRPLQPLLP
jgi:hypothetical protein